MNMDLNWNWIRIQVNREQENNNNNTTEEDNHNNNNNKSREETKRQSKATIVQQLQQNKSYITAKLQQQLQQKTMVLEWLGRFRQRLSIHDDDDKWSNALVCYGVTIQGNLCCWLLIEPGNSDQINLRGFTVLWKHCTSTMIIVIVHCNITSS